MNVADFAASPNPLAARYSRFKVGERLLLTGHSHQAWPDVAERGHLRAFADAAELADEKWGRAFEKADRVRRGFARLLDDDGPDAGHIALAPNTHDLLIRFLSALPFRERPKLLTTDGEFHTIRRQLGRLEEEGVEVVRVASSPGATVEERLIGALDDRVAALLVSSVFFDSGEIAANLGDVAKACERVGAELLVDAYHALNVAPFSVRRDGLERAFVVGGGYKYCQLGEGNCFLRFPRDCSLRPVFTGWFASFETLAEKATIGARRGPTHYGGGQARFAGSTYDPVSHYRAAEVFDFFEEHGLGAPLLRQVSQRQIGLLRDRFDALDLSPALIHRDRSLPLERQGGFLALRSPKAGELQAALRERGVLTDHRGEVLRFGPAPYLRDDQLTAAIDALGEAARAPRLR